MNRERLLRRILAGSLNNVSFADFTQLVEGFGFRPLRIKGSHRVYGHPALPERLNVQDVRGDAKPYQIRQLLQLVERYDLTLEDE